MKITKLVSLMVVLMLTFSFSIAAQEDVDEQNSDDENEIYYVPLDDGGPDDGQGPHDDGLTNEERDEIRSQYTPKEQAEFEQQMRQQDQERRGLALPDDSDALVEDGTDDVEAETDEPLEEEVVLDVDPGLTPDSPFYFLDDAIESMLIGDDPERAQEYREEKIAEATVMAREDNPEAALVALDRAGNYGDIVEREVTPDMESDVRQNAQDMRGALNQIRQDLPQVEVGQYIEQEDRIQLAAEVSTQIQQLCQTLSELDPVQYARMCRAGEDAPQWQIEMDQELSNEQREHAELFVDKMKQCMETEGQQCDCAGMGVDSFTRICERASANPENINPEEILAALPDYLRPLMEEMMNYMDDEMRRRGPPPGMEGPPFDDDFDPDEFMRECKQEKTKEQCVEEIERMMGERGRGPPDHRGPPDRIQEFGRDCHALEGEEKLRCFEEFYEGARQGFGEGFDRQYNGPMEVPPAVDPREWIGPFEERFAAAGSDSARKNVLRDIKREANERGFLVEEMGGMEGSFSIELYHEGDDKEFSYNYGGDFEVTTECLDVGARSPVACRRHMEDVSIWRQTEQDKLDEEARYLETIDPACEAAGALSPEACEQHKADVAALGPGCDDCASQCPGSSGTDCVNDRCVCLDDSGVSSGEESECADGCEQECGDQNTDCVDGNCVCLGYGDNGPPPEDGGDEGSSGGGQSSEPDSGEDNSGSVGEAVSDDKPPEPSTPPSSDSGSDSGSSDSGSGDSGSSDSSGSDSGSSDSGGDSGGDNTGDLAASSSNQITGGIIYFSALEEEKPDMVTGFFSAVLGIG